MMMSAKELQYVQDSLSHEMFLIKQCRESAAKLHDSSLADMVRQMEQKHTAMFNRLYNLI